MTTPPIADQLAQAPPLARLGSCSLKKLGKMSRARIAGSLADNGIACSMSRAGNVRDRAMGTPLMEWMAPAPGIAMCHIGCCHTDP